MNEAEFTVETYKYFKWVYQLRHKQENYNQLSPHEKSNFQVTCKRDVERIRKQGRKMYHFVKQNPQLKGTDYSLLTKEQGEWLSNVIKEHK